MVEYFPLYGLEVKSAPWLLRTTRTRKVIEVSGLMRPTLIVWSESVLRLMINHTHAEWHDDHDTEHCRTYTEGGGCRCDVEPPTVSGDI